MIFWRFLKNKMKALKNEDAEELLEDTEETENISMDAFLNDSFI